MHGGLEGHNETSIYGVLAGGSGDDRCFVLNQGRLWDETNVK